MDQGNSIEPNNVPSSWNYGSFHLQSRLYGSFIQNKADTSAVLQPKYEPLNKLPAAMDENGQYNLPPHDTPENKPRRASKVDSMRNDLRMDHIEPRKVFTSTGWQRTSKSVGAHKKVATEEYYRALKVYKEVSSNAKKLEMMNSKALSILLAGKANFC